MNTVTAVRGRRLRLGRNPLPEIAAAEADVRAVPFLAS